MITRASIFIKRSSKCNTSPTTTSRSAGLAVSTSSTLRVGAEVEVEIEEEAEVEIEVEVFDVLHLDELVIKMYARVIIVHYMTS